jgi:hypothetical protein
MNNRPVGGRSSETWSHPIDMIIIKDSLEINNVGRASYLKRRDDLEDLVMQRKLILKYILKK